MNALARKFTPVRPPERSTSSSASASIPSAAMVAAPNRTVRPLREARSASCSTTAGARSRTCRRSRPRCRRRRRKHDHHHQQLARHLLRPVDQSLSRLRARLRLLLRAADPCLYGPVAGPRFRNQAVRQAERGRSCCGRSWRSPATCRGRSRSAPTPIPTSRSSASYRIMRGDPRSAGRVQPSGRHRHQVGAGRCATSTSCRAMAEKRPGQGGAVGDHARPQARPRDGAARRDAAAAARRAPPCSPTPAFRPR